MRFVLHYRGPLRSNGDALHKHQIRQVFHRQLRLLWLQKPLSELWHKYHGPDGNSGFSFKHSVGQLVFVPLVLEALNTVAELRVVMLRPGPAGGLLVHGGDIDNRLKTLFDALSMPQANQIPTQVQSSEEPTFCLLQDDRLVTLVEVRAEQLLEEVEEPSTVDLTISVRTRVTRDSMVNGIFA